MKVHQFAHSPFCIPVTQVLTALGVPFETVEVPNHDRASLILLTGGQYYQVPVLEDKGAVIFESGPDTQDVARYLDREYAGGRLFPDRWDGLQALLIPHLENDVEEVTFKLCDSGYWDDVPDLVARVMGLRHKERKFGRGCVAAWKAQKPALTAEAACLLKPFDQMLAHTPFLTGDSPVYTDFLLFGILGNLTWKGYNELPKGQPHLADWHQRLAAFRF